MATYGNSGTAPDLARNEEIELNRTGPSNSSNWSDCGSLPKVLQLGVHGGRFLHDFTWRNPEPMPHRVLHPKRRCGWIQQNSNMIQPIDLINSSTWITHQSKHQSMHQSMHESMHESTHQLVMLVILVMLIPCSPASDALLSLNSLNSVRR